MGESADLTSFIVVVGGFAVLLVDAQKERDTEVSSWDFATA